MAKGELSVEPAVAFAKGEARGRMTLYRDTGEVDGDGEAVLEVLWYATGNWYAEQNRRSFKKKCAELAFPDPTKGEGEEPAAFDARVRQNAADRARAADEVEAKIIARLEQLERGRAADAKKAAATPAPAGRAAGAQPVNGNGHGDAGAATRSGQDLPAVFLGTDESRVADEAIGHLAADPDVYQRGGLLVRVTPTKGILNGIRRDGSNTIAALPLASLRERMTKFMTFTKVDRRRDAEIEVAAHPPAWLVQAAFSRGTWPDGIRPLTGLSDSPVLRPDGSVWQTRGYDAHTGVLYDPGVKFPPVATDATIDDADAAVEALKEVVCDFPFESDEHLASWVAGLLSPLARYAYDGPTPLFLNDANVRGAGKGLLAQAVGHIVLGREMPSSSFAPNPEEMTKKITAIALAGDRVVNLDNLEGDFGNAPLESAITSTRWKERVLGVSKEVEMPLLAVWYASGNNVQLKGDMPRRIIHARLDVLEQNPENRTGFKHPNLLRWVQKNRPRLLTQAITILTAFCNAGRPCQGLPSFGSFEAWSDLVRQAVVWAGLPDPYLTRLKLVEMSDRSAANLGQLVQAWKDYHQAGSGGAPVGVVVADMLNILYSKNWNERPQTPAANVLRAALEQITSVPPGKEPTARQVGDKLKAFRRRVQNDHYFHADENRTNKGTVWRLYHKVNQNKA